MKKILVAIALVVVMATLLMLPVAGADNAKVSVEELIKWNVLGENDIHYVGAPTTTPPTQDGSIKENEYSYSFRMTDPIYECDSGYNKIGTNSCTDFSSVCVDYYFSYDEDYIYIGIYDDQSRYAGKDINFFTCFGIDLEDITNLDNRYSGSKSGKAQLTVRGGTVKDLTNSNRSDPKKWDTRTVDVNGKAIRRVDTVYAICSDDGFGSYDTVYEFRYDRDAMTEIFNGVYGTNHVENPKAFLYTTYHIQYGKNAGDIYSYFRWCGRELTNVERMNLGTKAVDYIPAVVVLGDKETDFLGNAALEVPTKPVETEAPTTEAPTTEPETEAPATEPVTEAPTTEATEAPVTEAPETEGPKSEGGCGSSVAAMGIALVVALGTCATVVSKKKED